MKNEEVLLVLQRDFQWTSPINRGESPTRSRASTELIQAWKLTVGICLRQNLVVILVNILQSSIFNLQLIHPLSSIGTNFLSFTPIYSEVGRIRRLSLYCSMICAVHPTMRLAAKIVVNKCVSIPIECKTLAE